MANKVAIFLIQTYKKLISPILPPSCRFTPSCSEYALIAFSQLSFFRAFFLTFLRILRCNPLSPGGFDPVPDTIRKDTKE
ncbi:MAG: membrane protein insertion efficiency factor YidD [Leptospiraceae bacterium]|nr:membrane protein insertion efficiency factor YidD [Leptospiraceae bacterium]MCP5513593.1 membrane protein insertion efficiency factor YidD [Leptospiraceae bacterium]